MTGPSRPILTTITLRLHERCHSRKIRIFAEGDYPGPTIDVNEGDEVRVRQLPRFIKLL